MLAWSMSCIPAKGPAQASCDLMQCTSESVSGSCEGQEPMRVERAAHRRASCKRWKMSSRRRLPRSQIPLLVRLLGLHERERVALDALLVLSRLRLFSTKKCAPTLLQPASLPMLSAAAARARSLPAAGATPVLPLLPPLALALAEASVQGQVLAPFTAASLL